MASENVKEFTDGLFSRRPTFGTLLGEILNLDSNSDEESLI